MEQSILNNNITSNCPTREPNIFLELLDQEYISLSLLYGGFDATTSNHVWEQSNLLDNSWATIQTGGVNLNNANLLPLSGAFNIIRVKYTDNCGYNHYTEAVTFYPTV